MASGGGEQSQVKIFAQEINEIDGRILCGVDFNASPKDGVQYGAPDWITRNNRRQPALTYFMLHAAMYTAHEELTGKHMRSTWQRRCCGEQGEKIVTKEEPLRDHSKAIDHSFFRGFIPQATMSLPGDTEHGVTEIERRWQKGGLPAAGNSSDHIYACIEYEMQRESPKKDEKGKWNCRGWRKNRRAFQVKPGAFGQ